MRIKQNQKIEIDDTVLIVSDNAEDIVRWVGKDMYGHPRYALRNKPFTKYGRHSIKLVKKGAK